MSTAIVPVTATLVEPAQLKPFSQKLVEYLGPEARALVLETDADLQLAANIINDIAAELDKLEAVRQAVSLPISRGLDNYNALFRGPKAKAKEARELWDGKIRAFVEAREATQRAAEVELQRAIDAQDAPRATAAITTFQPAPKAVGLGLQDAWGFEEINHDIVPTSLTILDQRAVRAEINRQLAEGVTEPAIGGLRIFKRPVVKAVG